MTTKLNMTRDINGYNAFGLVPSDTNKSVTLTASTDTTFTMPGASGMGGNGFYQKATWLVIFNITPGDEVWVAINATAGVPAGASFAATASMLNPAALQLNNGDVIHCFSTNTGANVSIRLYSLS